MKTEIGSEYYDNSCLAAIDKCPRYAYWAYVFKLTNDQRLPGLKTQLGLPAIFGSCIHNALELYYSTSLTSVNKRQRRLAAMDLFATRYEQMTTNVGTGNERLTLEKGIRLLDTYFDQYELEDEMYFEPVGSEQTIAIEITPEPGEPDFKPFWFAFKIDIILRRKRENDLLVVETKTSSNARLKSEQMQLNRQAEGYVWALSKVLKDKQPRISGYMINILDTRALSCKRDIVFVNKRRLIEWRRETIVKVLQWRALKAIAEQTATIDDHISSFPRDTQRCFDYFRPCEFYNLCKYGHTEIANGGYKPRDWDVLDA